MCGFAGFLSSNKNGSDFSSVLKCMGNEIESRGPDSYGTWIDSSAALGFVHRRLAIVDLSEAGHQPMRSATGRFVITFNGEIYNHLEIREELNSITSRKWIGHSDTETLLEAIEQWGLKKALQKMTGMFALALWDNKEETLQLARDRFGEKPLYYGVHGGTLLFGSQLSALKVHPDFNPEINRDAITLLLRHNYIPAPYSIYNNTYKLLPASIVSFNTAFESQSEEYWSVHDVIQQSYKKVDNIDEAEHLSSLEVILRKSVSEQMLADVPLGAFLSGGIDSSLIVALMQAQSAKPVKTFSIGFEDKRYNEAEFAKEIAHHLGTEHTELYVSAQDALDVIPKLAQIYDEPFSDSSQIPTYLVSKMAKNYVTVSLSGDAGDELFCGYSRYSEVSSSWGKISKIPLVIRKFLASIILAIPVRSWNALSFIIPKKYKSFNLGDKLHKAADFLSSISFNQLYLKVLSHWQVPEEIVLNSSEPMTAITDPKRKISLEDPVLQMMADDTVSYLPDDILVKVDRAAMAVSLETRVPFLNHNVFEKAWQLPKSLKIRKGQSKWCLRQILYKYVPEKLIERPKMGFAVPLDIWLRSDLRNWADNLLSEERLVSEGFFDAAKVRTMWQQHLSGERNWQYQLWDVLMFQAWYEYHHKK